MALSELEGMIKEATKLLQDNPFIRVIKLVDLRGNEAFLESPYLTPNCTPSREALKKAMENYKVA